MQRFSKVMVGICLLAVMATAPATAATDAPVPLPKGAIPTPLPDFFRPGNKVPFIWWQDKDTIHGVAIIEEVQGEWVRFHTPENALRGWVHPATMNAMWGGD